MDSSVDKTHRTGTTTTSELFICFTSRLSSSSMKISSKSSILSPGRARDPPISLSTSLSRRLRTSGSIKNGLASPMFPTGGRKRGSGFENPEPSSPKVTCIGQVRVKTKKQGKKMRTLSSRSRRSSGEVSFRKIEHDQIQRQGSVNNQYHHQQQECSSHRNQRWVHLPLTICETLRGFGAEFSCLFPCKSSCFSATERDKEEVKVGREGNGGGGGQGSCVGVFARWLVAVQDGEGGKEREIELVVGGGDEEEMPVRSSRRHVFDEIEIRDDIFGVKDSSVEGEEGRVSICVPPKNALLLMRCRSDPVKMEALANRLWEPQLPKEEEEQDGEERENDGKIEEVLYVEKGGDKVENFKVFEEQRISVSVDTSYEEQENNPEAENRLETEVQDNEEEKLLLEDLKISEEVKDGEQEKEGETEENKIPVEEENELSFLTALEGFVDQESESESEEVDKHDPVADKNEEESRVSYGYNSSTPHSDEEICKPEEKEEEKEELAEEPALELDAMESSTAEKETQGKNLLVKTMEKVTQEEEEEESTVKTGEKEKQRKSVEVLERESDLELKKEEREGSSLPDCLLLMMCEPKLSMEVSKETWVCSTDFIRWQPQKKKKPAKVKESDGGDEPTKKRVSVDSNSANPFAALPPPHPAAQQPLLQPPRSSCSLPGAAVSMATMIEQKLVNAVAYEPFVLTRCKSEPMRTASKLAQDACFWKNGGLEPHRRSTVGVGAAGVGF